MSEPLRAVLAGAGALGPYWARELLENPETELVAGPAAAAAVFRMTGDLRFSFVGNWAAPRNETGVASLAHFVAAIRTGRVPQGECHDNIRSLAMCHAAVESAALGAPVSVAG